jgi:flavin reductase (DIM6/NTAB) family NADH-FMN oxidoreductase RutF
LKYDLSKIEYKEAHDLVLPIITPRPITLVSTVGKNGVLNVAPYSFYGVVHWKPALVYLSIVDRRRRQERKDTINNILYSKDFVLNTVTEDMVAAMAKCGNDLPPDQSEFTASGLTPVPCDLVKAPRVGESPISMECRMVQNLAFGEFPESANLIIGEVLRIHVKDEFVVNGVFQPEKLNLIGRMCDSFCRTNDTFEA